MSAIASLGSLTLTVCIGMGSRARAMRDLRLGAQLASVARRLGTLLLLGLACSSCERRQERVRPPVIQYKQATPYEFLGAVISSLAHAQDGINLARAAAKERNLADLMTANQNAAIDVRMAEGDLRPFSPCRDSTRQSAIDGLVSGYDLILQSLAIQLSGYEKMDSARAASDLVGLNRQVSNSKVAYQQGSAILFEATTIAFGSIAVEGPQGPNGPAALDLSAGEKEKLLAELRTRFGTALSDTTDDSGPTSSARLLFRGLSQQWRLAR